MIRSEFDELMQLSVEAGTLKRPVAYERYVDHLRRTHPGAPIPTERDFWRQKYADQERNPTSRCC